MGIPIMEAAIWGQQPTWGDAPRDATVEAGRAPATVVAVLRGKAGSSIADVEPDTFPMGRRTDVVECVLMVCSTDVHEVAGLTAEPLFEDRYCVVARRGHPTIRGRIDIAVWATTGHVFASSHMAFDDVTGPTVGEDPMPSTDEVASIALVPRLAMALAIVANSDAIPTGSFELSMAEKELARTEVASLLIDRRDLDTSEAMRPMRPRLTVDHGNPCIDETCLLSPAEVVSRPGAAREKPVVIAPATNREPHGQRVPDR